MVDFFIAFASIFARPFLEDINLADKKKTREEPRLSVNKMGEYLAATPRRRSRIIKDAKHPSDFIVPRYTEASSAVVQYLTSGDLNEEVLINAMIEFENAIPETSWEAEKNGSCRDALEAFLDIDGFPDLSEYTVRAGGNDAKKLKFNNVTISVRPEILLQVTRRNKKLVGAIKLHFSKSHTILEDAAAYVGAMVQDYLEKHHEVEGTASYRDIFIVDVFEKRVFFAPKNNTRRMQDVKAACDEISQRWGFF